MFLGYFFKETSERTHSDPHKLRKRNQETAAARPTFDIDVAAADIEVVKSKPLVDKRAVIIKKITIYKSSFLHFNKT